MDDTKDLDARFERLYSATNTHSDAALARALGINQASVAGARKRGQVPSGWVEKIAKDYDINSDWLFFGRGAMRVEQAPPAGIPGSEVAHRLLASRAQSEAEGGVIEAGGQRIIDCDDCQIVMLPMVEARLSAGNGSFETGGNGERRYAFRTDFLMRKGQPASMVLMRVAGDSMEPEVHHNDVVLIDQSQRTPRPGGLYAVGVEDLVYLKVVNAAPGKLILTSYNAAYPPMEVDARGDLEDGIRIIGKAVWVGRELT